MRDRGVNRYHQIEMRYQRRGVGEPCKLVTEMNDVGAFPKRRHIGGANLFLQADERGVDIKERQQTAQIDRPLPVPDVFRVAGPGYSDPRARLDRKPGTPFQQRLIRRAQIGHSRRDRFKLRPECQRQAEKRTLQVEIRQRIALGDDPRGAGEASQKAHKRLLDLQNNARTLCRDQRHIAAELNGVAKSLLAVKQDGLARDLPTSEPVRLREITPPRSRRSTLAAPLILDPATTEVTSEKLRHAAEKMRIGMVGPQGDGAIVTGQRLIKPLQAMQRDAAIDHRIGMIRLQGKGTIITSQCLVEPPEPVQRNAAIAEGGSMVRLHGERPLMALHRPPGLGG